MKKNLKFISYLIVILLLLFLGGLNFLDNNKSVRKIIDKEIISNNILTKSVLVSNKYEGYAHLDQPFDVVKGEVLRITGWAVSSVGNSIIKVYLDGVDVTNQITRNKRDDVIEYFGGKYSDELNPLPGFDSFLDVSGYADGKHTARLEILSPNNEVIAYTNKIFTLDKYEGYAHLDQPFEVVKGDVLRITGWGVSNVGNSIIKVYFDGVDVTSQITRNKRDDVIRYFDGKYSDELNPLPGFDSFIDVSGYESGNYVVRLDILSRSGKVIDSTVRNFYLDKYEGYAHLDQPFSQVNGDVLRITGWAVSECRDSIIKVYLDGVDVASQITRNKRDDVIEFFGGKYRDDLNPLPGFDSFIDVSGYNDGEHVARLEILSNNGGLIASTTKKFKLHKYEGYAHLDQPFDKARGNILRITGWGVSTGKNSVIKVYLNDVDITSQITRNKRDDVIEFFGGKYRDDLNPEPGFDSFIDVSGYTDGEYIARLEVLSSRGKLISSTTKEFYLDKYDGEASLEETNSEVSSDVLEITGWAVSDCKDSYVKLYLDGNDISDKVIRNKRDDVIDKLDGKYNKEDNLQSGIQASVAVSLYKDGEHVIRMELFSNDGQKITTAEKKIQLDKYEGYAHLDQPFDDVTGRVVRITGWAVSECRDSIIKVYLDDVDVTSQITRNKRDDVIELFGGKYSDELNPLPGFDSFIDVSGYVDGRHVVRLEILSKVGDVIASITKEFNLKKYDGMIHVDFPTKTNYSVDSTLTVSGWELSELDNSVVKVYLDEVELSVSRREREDVILAYPDKYGGSNVNATPGYDASISLDGFSKGLHNIKIVLYSKLGELITSKEMSIYIYNDVYFGIDVSSWQGVVDWESVSKTGIDFAILRLGYGDDYTSQDDKYFMRNVQECTKYNIPFGVYIYSYATSLDGSEASISSELAHVYRVLNNLNVSQKSMMKLPVYLDMENDGTIYLGKDTLTSFADYFCNNMEMSGYNCGIYANKNWFNNYLNGSYLGSKYDIWLAHYTGDYNNRSDYPFVYQMWQYTSKGNLTGINGNLDMNVSYFKYW